MSNTKDEFKMFTYLGQKIKDDALKESACMQEELRELIGCIRGYSVFTGDSSFEDFIPFLRIMARYNWHRMEVTDLSLMLGENITNVSFRKRDESTNRDTIQEDIDEDI